MSGFELMVLSIGIGIVAELRDARGARSLVLHAASACFAGAGALTAMRVL